jgi:hypothetical protein
VNLSTEQRAFIESHPAAAMITIGDDGIPKAVRVGVALVDGKLWSSGTGDRVRTNRLRDDPRSTLFVFAGGGFDYLTMETTVTILDGPDVPDQSLRLFRVMQRRPDGPLSWFGGELDDDAFRARMVEEGRLIYEFDVHVAYGIA